MCIHIPFTKGRECCDLFTFIDAKQIGSLLAGGGECRSIAIVRNRSAR
jgi:hypothetical protein